MTLSRWSLHPFDHYVKRVKCAFSMIKELVIQIPKQKEKGSRKIQRTIFDNFISSEKRERGTQELSKTILKRKK